MFGINNVTSGFLLSTQFPEIRGILILLLGVFAQSVCYIRRDVDQFTPRPRRISCLFAIADQSVFSSCQRRCLIGLFHRFNLQRNFESEPRKNMEWWTVFKVLHFSHCNFFKLPVLVFVCFCPDFFPNFFQRNYNTFDHCPPSIADENKQNIYVKRTHKGVYSESGELTSF